MSIICLLSFSFAGLLFDTISFLLKNNRWKLFQPLSDQVQFSFQHLKQYKSMDENQRLIIKVLKLATYLLVDISLLSKQDLGKTLLNKSRYFNQLEIGSKIPTGYQNPTVFFSELFVDSDCPLSLPPNQTTTQLTKHPIHSSFLFQSHIEFHLRLMRAPALLFGLFCDVLAKRFPPSSPFTVKLSGGACCP